MKRLVETSIVALAFTASLALAVPAQAYNTGVFVPSPSTISANSACAGRRVALQKLDSPVTIAATHDGTASGRPDAMSGTYNYIAYFEELDTQAAAPSRHFAEGSILFYLNATSSGASLTVFEGFGLQRLPTRVDRWRAATIEVSSSGRWQITGGSFNTGRNGDDCSDEMQRLYPMEAPQQFGGPLDNATLVSTNTACPDRAYEFRRLSNQVSILDSFYDSSGAQIMPFGSMSNRPTFSHVAMIQRRGAAMENTGWESGGITLYLIYQGFWKNEHHYEGYNAWSSGMSGLRNAHYHNMIQLTVDTAGVLNSTSADVCSQNMRP